MMEPVCELLIVVDHMIFEPHVTHLVRIENQLKINV